jgi:hypothetical protein
MPRPHHCFQIHISAQNESPERIPYSLSFDHENNVKFTFNKHSMRIFQPCKSELGLLEQTISQCVSKLWSDCRSRLHDTIFVLQEPTFCDNLRALLQSEEVHKAAYESGWYDMPPHVKWQIQMIIMRGQKPVALRTGQFGLLSMPLFAEVSLLPRSVCPWHDDSVIEWEPNILSASHVIV